MLTRGVGTPLMKLNLKIPDEYGKEVGFANPNMTKLVQKDGTELFIVTMNNSVPSF